VASSGTALTHEQIRLLHRFTSNIVVLYDGDAAGIKASKRGIDMLLREGMNVKLMLLPDGKDPDEFGREHTAQEFQAYMRDNQVDFIKFKTDLLLKEAKGDPIALSRLVNDIVQSIAVIPDEITRTFYIRETAQMMQMQERLITDAVGKQVKANIEEWRKEKERENKRLQGQQGGSANTSNSGTNIVGTSNAGMNGPAPQGTQYEPLPDDFPPPPEALEGLGDISNAPANQPAGGNPYHTAAPQTSAVRRDKNTQEAKETLIVQMVIRHGETIICNVNDDEGKEVPLSVVEYVYYALHEDQLDLTDPMHQRILNETLEHVHEAGFVAEKYFLNHPDQGLCSLAFDLVTDKEELSKFYENQQQINPAEKTNQLMDQVNHLLIDLKLCIVEKQKKDLMQQMRDPQLLKDKERCRELISQFQQIKEVENALAKACGDRVFMH